MITELFRPKNIGTVTIPNRLIVSAMVVNVCNDDGTLTDRFIDYHEEKAKGGWGLIITEDYGISADAKGYSNIPGLWDDAQIPGNKELTRRIHNHGAKIFCQIYHSGKQKMPNVPGQPLAPSAIKDPLVQNMPRELTVPEIRQIVKQFGACACRAKESGFDGLEIHAAHGYLIAQFLSWFINKRTDEYGGCFANRCRFLDEVYAEVRKNVGPDFPIMVRISVNEYAPGGRKEAESYALARHLDELGVDAIHVSNGTYASDMEHSIITNMFADNAFNTDAAQQIKSLVSCPVVTVNKIHDAQLALLGNVDVKPGPVVVCGGGEVGGETAEFIAQTNHDVTILEMRPSILADMFIGNMGSLLQHIQANGIRSITNATVTAINETGVSYSDGEGKIHTIPAATVVSAFGYRAYNPLEETAKAACKEVHVVGSAVKAGNALVAIREGYLAGMAL